MLPLRGGNDLVHSHQLILIDLRRSAKRSINEPHSGYKTEQESSLPDAGRRVVNTTKQSTVSQLRHTLERQGVAGVAGVPLDGVLVVVVQRFPTGHCQAGQQYLQYSELSLPQKFSKKNPRLD